MATKPVVLLGVGLLLILAACGGAFTRESLQVHQSPGAYALTVPASRLVLTVPRGRFVPRVVRAGGGTNNPRYFRFEDSRTQNAHLIISGWFEPAEIFPGVKGHWEQELEMFKRAGLPEPLNVTFNRLGNWEAVVWDSRTGIDANSHLRAHWVQADTWIDVHLSVTAYYSNAECRQILMAMLRTLEITEREPTLLTAR